MKITKPLKEIMIRSGRLKKARGSAISKEISKTDTFDEQMAVAMNAIEAIFTFIEVNYGKDIRPDDCKAYQQRRSAAKMYVDKEIENL